MVLAAFRCPPGHSGHRRDPGGSARSHPIGFLQGLYNLLLLFPGNVPQDRPGTTNLTHLPGCTEEGGFSRLQDAGMPIQDDQLKPDEPPFFEVLETVPGRIDLA